jgi:hypothetical protein
MPIQQPQPTTVPGRPDIPNAEVTKVLRGVPPPPFPTPEDKLPIPQLKLPKGFKIEVYASGIANARSLRLGDKGTVFVSNRVLDKVYAVVDTGREAKQKHRLVWIAQTVWRFHKGTLLSLKAPRFPSSKTSRTTWTIRLNPSSSTAICRTISRTAGDISASARTTRSI